MLCWLSLTRLLMGPCSSAFSCDFADLAQSASMHPGCIKRADLLPSWIASVDLANAERLLWCSAQHACGMLYNCPTVRM